MPALNLIISADATRVHKEMALMAQLSAKTAKKIQADWAAMAAAMQRDSARAFRPPRTFLEQGLDLFRGARRRATGEHYGIADPATARSAINRFPFVPPTDEQRRLESVEEAARRRRTGYLLRERAEARQSRLDAMTEQRRLDSIEIASRANLAGRLRRQHKEYWDGIRQQEAEGARKTSIAGRLRTIGGTIWGQFGGIYAAYRAKQFISDAIQTDIAFQRVQNTLEAVTGDTASATKEFQFLLAESKRIGFSFTGLADTYAKFAVASKSAGLSTEQTRHIFSSVQAAAVVMGLSTERVADAFLALEQMLAKGKLSMEEVRRQFGNAIPGAMNIMARSLGVTLPKLYELIETGQLLSADVLPRLADQFQREFNLTPEINKTLRDLSRLQTAWAELKAEVGKGLRSNVEGISENLVVMLKLLNEIPRAAAAIDKATGTTSLQRMFPVFAMLAEGAAFLGRLSAWLTGGAGIKTSPEEAAALDAARYAREDARAKTLAPFKPSTAVEDEKERLRVANEIAKIEERITEIRLRNYLNSLSREDRLVVLKKQEAALVYFIDKLSKQPGISGVVTPEQIAKARLDLEEVRSQIISQADKPARSTGMSLGNLNPARAGAYAGGPTIEVSLLDVNKQMLAELRDINRRLGQPQPLARSPQEAY